MDEYVLGEDGLFTIKDDDRNRKFVALKQNYKTLEVQTWVSMGWNEFDKRAKKMIEDKMEVTSSKKDFTGFSILNYSFKEDYMGGKDDRIGLVSYLIIKPHIIDPKRY